MFSKVTLIFMKFFKTFVFSLITADFPLFIVSLYVFLSNPPPELPPTSNFPHLLRQELFSILSRQPNHGNALFCKHCYSTVVYSEVQQQKSDPLV